MFFIAGVAFAIGSEAAVFTYDVTPSATLSSTPTFFSVNTASAAGQRARAAAITGRWGGSTGNAESSELRLRIAGMTDVGGGQLDRSVGGTSGTSTFSFLQPNFATWNNTAVWNNLPFDPYTSNQLANAGSSDLGGVLSVGIKQSFTGSGATLNGAQISFYTDAITPFSGSIGSSNPTFQRPISLTALSNSANNVRYAAHSFVAPGTGSNPFAVGMFLEESLTNDSVLMVYQGAFDPLNPLVNLIGVDDDGALGVLGGSSLWLNLTGGSSYTLVASTWGNNTVLTGYTAYVAGVPEPMTMTALALVALAAKRRKKAAKK
jgi:hypothetical protein